MLDCFTFLMDFKGGTYVSQVNATFETASTIWAKSINTNEVPGMDELQQRLLIGCIDEERPAALDGIPNTWCITAMIDNALAVIHIVKTVPRVRVG